MSPAPTPTPPEFIEKAKRWCESIALMSDGEIACKLADQLYSEHVAKQQAERLAGALKQYQQSRRGGECMYERKCQNCGRYTNHRQGNCAVCLDELAEKELAAWEEGK